MSSETSHIYALQSVYLDMVGVSRLVEYSIDGDGRTPSGARINSESWIDYLSGGFGDGDNTSPSDKDNLGWINLMMMGDGEHYAF